MPFAYPGTDLVLQDQLTTDAFLKGLWNQKVAYEVMRSDLQTPAEAQNLAKEHEHNFRLILDHDGGLRMGWARCVS